MVLSLWDYFDDVNGSEKEDPATVGILGCRREREPEVAGINSLFSALDCGCHVTSCFRLLLTPLPDDGRYDEL